MPDLTIKQHDLWPPFQATLQANGSALDLSTAQSVIVLMKGTTAQNPVLIDGTCTVQQAAFTATTQANSPTLQNVSNFANIVAPANGLPGSTITAPGILPAGTTVLAVNPTAQTITLSNSALTSGASIPLIANLGVVQYAWNVGDTNVVDIYNTEWQITWSNGKIETVPNTGYNSVQIVADLGP